VERASERGERTEGSFGTTLLDDTRGGVALERLDVLADAGKVVGGAAGLGLDNIVETAEGTLRDVGAALGAHDGSEGNSDEGELHFD
jgi:hypothetical protein